MIERTTSKVTTVDSELEADDSDVEAATPSVERGSGARVGVTAFVELVLGSVAAFFAYDGLRAAGPPPDGAWGWLALALFCLPLALLNFLAPRLKARFSETVPEVFRLPVRLSTYDGTANVVWTILGLGIAFTGPAIPLAILSLRLRARGSEFVLVPTGLGLCTAVTGILMLAISASHVYKLLVKGDAVVETTSAELEPGQAAPVFVSYQPGRATPHSIAVHLVCRETTRKRRSGRHVSGTGSYVYEKRVLHDVKLASEQPFDGSRIGPWEQMVTIELPPEARPSTAADYYPTIDWGVEVVISVALLPDFRLTYPFKVVSNDPAALLLDDESDSAMLIDDESA